MPFDNTLQRGNCFDDRQPHPVTEAPIHTVLKGVIELLSDKTRWTKGRPIKEYKSRPPSFCIMGAVQHVAKTQGLHMYQCTPLISCLARGAAIANSKCWWQYRARRCIGIECSISSVIYFNDRHRTTHKKLMSMLRETAELLKRSNQHAI